MRRIEGLRRGAEAESRACDYLNAQGLQLIERNYRTPRGEIDLVMLDGPELVFVEVRARRNAEFGTALETVDRNKQKRLVFAANHYLVRSRHAGPSRFDVVGLSGPPGNETIDWVKNAFQT